MAKKKGAKKNAKKVTPAKSLSITDSINSEVIAAALSSVNQPVLLKVCRLCEAKDGPFLNIFDADKVTAKKIETVMPFGIAENDDLPHKICFRCSAKVEELYEFIQKCINTQKSLRKAVGAKGPIFNKPRHRELWEEKLNQSNISNDDICDALIKKAMEGIKDIPLNPPPLSEEDNQVLSKFIKKTPSVDEDDSTLNNLKEAKETDAQTKMGKLTIKNLLQEPVTKSLRSNVENTIDDIEKKATRVDDKRATIVDKTVKNNNSSLESSSNNKNVSDKKIMQTNTFSLDEVSKPQPESKFNIMDHVSMIKVNGVGVLFQCKICNRNFLKKEVVMSHACAKNGLVKIAGPKSFTPPEPPKIPSVKYINTKEVKKPVVSNNENCQFINLDDEDEDDKPLVIKKPKPRIGPASRVKRRNTSTSEDSSLPASDNHTQIHVKPKLSSTVQEPTVQFPTLPSLNTRYKLLPGPNNTFTLVEEKVVDKDASPQEKPATTPTCDETPVLANDKVNTRLNIASKRAKTSSKCSVTDHAAKADNSMKSDNSSTSNQPYPVGLFKTLPTNTCTDVPIETEPTFTTPAMKKQSYTVVQTGNPSKLLISSKPQTAVQEVPKKRQRKTKHEVKADLSNKQPFSVTLEDAAPPRDTGFFTFINVDPLLQPSYVLPTNNIIQESQISTSTSVSKQSEKEKETSKYTCNMCDESFTREKKLLAHIQSHYSKMDEEDQLRSERNTRKRKK
ncbi:uncharacterized protein LOC124538791 [Vanessa cardui]|uniref:uncharacterized protein LOC124538791 n=1 Tax=Vanessa cardui TaxID=171605 RepID=UPI001F12D296|nr:uncharacterized protein LOC124538791 [Vanessa cardui]